MSNPIDLDRNTGLPTEGTHLFKVTAAKETPNKNSGDPQWVLDFTCQDAGPDQGTVMSVFMQTVGKGRFVLNEFLDAIEAPKKGQMRVEDTMGKLVRITVVHEEYNAKMSAKPQAWHVKSSTNNPEVKHVAQAKSTLPSDGTRKPSPF